MVLSSRLQGLHQVAKNAIIKGFPLLDKVSVCMVLPSMSLSVILGNLPCALLPKHTGNRQRNSRIFLILFVYRAVIMI